MTSVDDSDVELPSSAELFEESTDEQPSEELQAGLVTDEEITSLPAPDATDLEYQPSARSRETLSRTAVGATPTRRTEPPGRAVEIARAQPEPLAGATALAAPHSDVVPAFSVDSQPVGPANAVPVAGTAPPADVVPTTAVGPLTGLLALLGLQPAPPGTPETPLSQLIELVWVAVRRIEYTLFNYTPTATPTISELDENTGVVTGDIGGADRDPEDGLAYSIVDGPAHGDVELNPDGTFTYTPDADWAHQTAGTDTFTVKVREVAAALHFHLLSEGRHSVTVPVTVTITPVNHDPEQWADPVINDPDDNAVVTGEVFVRDPDGDDVSLAAETTKGTVSITDDGIFEFEPTTEAREQAAAPDASPEDKQAIVNVVATDGYGGESSFTMTVDVLPAESQFPGITFPDGATPSDVLIAGDDPNTIYVLVGSEIRIVDTATGDVIGEPIDLTVTPFSIAISPDATTVYVAPFDGSGVSIPVLKIDTATGVATEIGAIRQGIAMLVSPDGKTLYVMNNQDGTVSVIDTDTGETGTENVALQADAIALGPDGAIYTTSLINDLRGVDASGNAIQIPNEEYGEIQTSHSIVVSPLGDLVYVTDSVNGVLSVYDPAAQTVTHIEVGDSPTSAAISADGDYVYVANRGENSVSVVDTMSLTVVATIPLPDGPSHIDLSSDGAQLLVTTDEGVAVVVVADIVLDSSAIEA